MPSPETDFTFFEFIHFMAHIYICVYLCLCVYVRVLSVYISMKMFTLLFQLICSLNYRRLAKQPRSRKCKTCLSPACCVTVKKLYLVATSVGQMYKPDIEQENTSDSCFSYGNY